MPGFLMFWGAILLIFFALVPFISVNVPAVTGLVLLNVFKDAGPKQKDNLRPVGPGIHLKWPWESVREENFFLLELVTEKFEETYAAWDGPLMLAKVSFQYQPTVKRLLAFIAVDKTTINEGFKGVFSSFLSETIGARELGGQESGSVFVRTHVKVVEQAVTDKIDTYPGLSAGAFGQGADGSRHRDRQAADRGDYRGREADHFRQGSRELGSCRTGQGQEEYRRSRGRSGRPASEGGRDPRFPNDCSEGRRVRCRMNRRESPSPRHS